MINACETLEQLRDCLNNFNGYALDGETKIDSVVDFSSLPLFSANDPRDTREMWSYDDTRFLVFNNEYAIVDRCPVCGEAPFHCKHD